MNLQQKVDTYLDSQRFLLSAGNSALRNLPERCPICRGDRSIKFCCRCAEHISVASMNNWRLADRTAFICYGEAKGKDQLGSDMHNYKKNEIQQPLQSEAKRRIVSLLYHTFSHYWDEANTPEITVLTAMPSLRDVNRNQLMQLVKNVASRLPNNLVVQQLLYPRELRGNKERERVLDPQLFYVDSDQVSGHVVIVEDSWVTGANAQSAAIALHQAGADYVTILSVARLLYENVMDSFKLQENHRFIAGGRPGQSPFWSFPPNTARLPPTPFRNH